MTASQYITPKAAAGRLGLSNKTIYRWIKTGRIRGYQIGRSIRLDEQEFLRWVEIHAKRITA